jgi:hypothetical protein
VLLEDFFLFLQALLSLSLLTIFCFSFKTTERYEECRLLGYKNPFRTSQETHYVSVTESSQLMLCNI